MREIIFFHYYFTAFITWRRFSETFQNADNPEASSSFRPNPAVTVCDAILKGIGWRDASAYFVAQIIGAIAGVGAANMMFELPVFFASHKARTGAAQWFSEFVATFGLLAVI